MSTVCTNCFHSKDRHYFSDSQNNNNNNKHYCKESECSCRQFREN